MPALAGRIKVSMIIKEQSNFISSLLVSQKRLETKVQKVKHMATLVMRIYFSMIIKKQSNFFSGLLLSQKRLEKKI